MRIKGFGIVLKEMVNAFEQKIGFDLPEDYKQFLLEKNGGKPEIKYAAFYIKELNQYSSLDILLGLGIKNQDILKRNEEYWDDLIQKCIIIGDDPGSGMIVLIEDDNNKGIYYWDHSFEFEQSNAKHNIYKISDSFQEFIDGLVDPELL